MRRKESFAANSEYSKLMAGEHTLCKGKMNPFLFLLVDCSVSLVIRKSMKTRVQFAHNLMMWTASPLPAQTEEGQGFEEYFYVAFARWKAGWGS